MSTALGCSTTRRARDHVADPEAVAVEHRHEQKHERPAAGDQARPARRVGPHQVARKQEPQRCPHLELADQVAREDRAGLELTTARVDHADPDLSLARRRPLPADLEQREVEVEQQEREDDDHSGEPRAFTADREPTGPT